MFTGIIDHTATIVELKKSNHHITAWIATQFTDLSLGESIAVDGICLTVNEIKSKTFRCDISPETLKITTAKHFTEHQNINAERALALGARIGGHMVSGHVDGIAIVKSMTEHDDFLEIHFGEIAPNDMPYLSQKGSIAVNGVSLTVNDITADGFAVMLIPHTLQITNLSQLQIGSKVNIEFDMTAKIIIEHCKRYMSSQ